MSYRGPGDVCKRLAFAHGAVVITFGVLESLGDGLQHEAVVILLVVRFGLGQELCQRTFCDDWRQPFGRLHYPHVPVR
ncbi:hypothetical protein D3C80_2164830 [compost metagenome]